MRCYTNEDCSSECCHNNSCTEVDICAAVGTGPAYIIYIIALVVIFLSLVIIILYEGAALRKERA